MRSNHRLNSAIAAAILQGAFGIALATALATTIERQPQDALAVVRLAPEPPPPPEPETRPTPVENAPVLAQPAARENWATANPIQRELAFKAIHKWVQDNLPEEERRLARWREALPQGSGPFQVTRLRPANLTTHTLYWPAKSSKRPLPIIVWGNDHGGSCSNSSLAYAAFLSEIASHGYFVVAVGNDDIEYPQPEGLAFLADGRPIRTDANALKKAVDWAIAENNRSGSPYQSRLDENEIAYMGHACGGRQAMTGLSDPRTTTIVLLNSNAKFSPRPSTTHKPPILQLEGGRDDSDVLDAGDANFAKARAGNWPMFKAALNGLGHTGAYPGPDRRWSRTVLAWLDWQLKDDSNAAAALNSLTGNGWSRIDTTVTNQSKTPEKLNPFTIKGQSNQAIIGWLVEPRGEVENSSNSLTQSFFSDFYSESCSHILQQISICCSLPAIQLRFSQLRVTCRTSAVGWEANRQI